MNPGQPTGVRYFHREKYPHREGHRGRHRDFTALGLLGWSGPDTNDTVAVYTVTQGGLDCTRTSADIEDESWGHPWGSSCGYRVTKDGWILSASGKRLLMLPNPWQWPYRIHRVWNGKYLAWLHNTLPGPVILELEP